MRHGWPKAGRGMDWAKWVERARSAFTKNQVILTLPNTDHIRKNFFTHPKSVLYNMIIDKAVSWKKFLYPKSQVKNMGGSLTIFKNFFISTLNLKQNQAPDIIAFMTQDPQTPLNGWKWAFLPKIWPSYQISGQKCGQIFDNFKKKFISALSTMGNQVPNIFAFITQDPQTPLNGWSFPSKARQNEDFTPNLALWLKIKLEKWADFFFLSKNFFSKDCFSSRIRCLTFLDF